MEPTFRLIGIFVVIFFIFIVSCSIAGEDFKLYDPDKNFESDSNLQLIKTNAEKNVEIGKLDEDAAEHIFKALEYAKEGNTDKQLEEYKLAIQLDPTYWMIDHYIARCCYINGRYKDAIAYYSKLIELRHEYTVLYEERALALTRIGLYSSALSDLNKVIAIKPKAGYLYYNRGCIYGKYLKFDDAITEFSKVIELEGDNIFQKNPKCCIKISLFPRCWRYMSYCYRGWAYYQIGDEKKAIRDLNKSIKIEPRCDDSYIYLGKIYQWKNKLRFAKYYYSKAIKTNPNNVEGYILRGLLYCKKGKNKKGCTDFKKACELGYCDLYEKVKKNGDCE